MDSRQKADQPTAADKRKKPEQPTEERPEPKYHVYIRLPFDRGDFVDPGTVCSFRGSASMTDLSVKGELEREEVRGAMEHPIRFSV